MLIYNISGNDCHSIGGNGNQMENANKAYNTQFKQNKLATKHYGMGERLNNDEYSCCVFWVFSSQNCVSSGVWN